MDSKENVGSLEEQALKRKERLNALKRKQNENHFENEEKTTLTLPKPQFRSYVPYDEKLKENKIAPAKPGDVASQVKDQLEAANTRVVIEDLDLTSLAPRKPDWDLKRDVSKKLERLEKRTQKAIAEIIREKLKAGETDFAATVAMGALGNSLDVDED